MLPVGYVLLFFSWVAFCFVCVASFLKLSLIGEHHLPPFYFRGAAVRCCRPEFVSETLSFFFAFRRFHVARFCCCATVSTATTSFYSDTCMHALRRDCMLPSLWFAFSDVKTSLAWCLPPPLPSPYRGVIINLPSAPCFFFRDVFALSFLWLVLLP